MVDISSKELVRNLFRLKDLPRIPFIPWICTFAAQLEQLNVVDMLSDAGLLSGALLNAQELFGYDAITTVFDPSLEAEACGCQVEWSDEEGSPPKIVSHPLAEGINPDELVISDLEKRGRIPVYVEAIKRINIIRGKQVAIAGMVTGPLTLAIHLKGDSLLDDIEKESNEATRVTALAGTIGLKLCRIYCESGVDVIVIADEMLGSVNPKLYQTIAAPLKSIWNVTKFFGAHSLILTRAPTVDRIEPILNLQAGGITLGNNIDQAILQESALKHQSCWGYSMFSSMLSDSTELADYAKNYISTKPRGCFLTTDWEVPYATNVDAMHEVMRVTRSTE